jgi:hypothetical protein
VLGFWILTQVWHVLTLQQGDTAWWAHVGGLIAGAALIIIMRQPGVLLFECMRPEDVVANAESGPASGTSGGPWGAR